MSDLRQVDRVMLETLRDDVLIPQKWRAREVHRNDLVQEAEEKIDRLNALLTEQPEQDEAGECRECGGTGDAPRQRGMSFTDCAECSGTGLAPEPVDQPVVFADAKCPDCNGAGGNPADICDTCAGSGLVPVMPEPAAPQPGLSDDSVERISLAVRLQEAEEKLARLEDAARAVVDGAVLYQYGQNPPPAMPGLAGPLNKLSELLPDTQREEHR